MDKDPTQEAGVHDASEIEMDAADSAAANEARKKEREQIAKTEGRFVFVLRMLVLVVLVASAIGVSMGVYLYTTNQEQQEFHTKFDSDAAKVLES
jgi:cell division protein FtsL